MRTGVSVREIYPGSGGLRGIGEGVEGRDSFNGTEKIDRLSPASVELSIRLTLSKSRRF